MRASWRVLPFAGFFFVPLQMVKTRISEYTIRISNTDSPISNRIKQISCEKGIFQAGIVKFYVKIGVFQVKLVKFHRISH